MIPARIVKAEAYNPRTPRKNQYYRCVEAHFEELAGVWDDRYQKDYGYWRPYILDVIYKYLDCGDLHLGFARVKCDDCQHEYLLPFSCKRRYFCPSCHQNGSSNSVNSFIPRYSNRCLIASGSLASLKGCGAILCMIAACYPN